MSETPDSGSVFSTYLPRKKKGSRKRRRLFIFLTIVGLGVISPFVFYGMVAWGFFGPLPDETALQNLQRPVASTVYAADGSILGRYFLENRTEVAFEDMSPHVWEALIATEDARFRQHAGVDWKALGRVAVKSVLLRQSSAGGGSTISQQLAKNLFPRQSYAMFSLPINKVREMIIAKKLEKLYGKEKILALYLNTVPFGERVFGIGAATERFFSTTPKKIAPEKAAVLVGMLKGTTSYNPRRNPERATKRRNLVLGLMADQGFLTEEESDSLQALELDLQYRNIDKGIGKAPYFRQVLAEELKVWLANHPKPDGSAWNLYTDGLHIHTTIDPRIQQMAEKAVKSHLRSLQKQFDQHWKGRTLWQDSDPTLLRAIRQS
ncbi:MAG: transglycosylase domain-containing protein, partial [Bacteroidota bacterium]